MNPKLRDMVLDMTKAYEFPILAEMDFGHQQPNMPLPEGLLVRMDAEQRMLEYLEAMVEE